MPRTTVYIEDELYKKLVEESIAKYGSTKHLSKIINEKLIIAEKLSKQKRKKSLPIVSIGKRINWKFVEKVVEKEIEKLWKE